MGTCCSKSKSIQKRKIKQDCSCCSLKEYASSEEMLKVLKIFSKDFVKTEDIGSEISNKDNTTVSIAPDTITGGVLNIRDCKDSTIICIDLIKSLIVDRCENTTIIVIGVSGSAFLRDCTHCIISTVSRQLRLKGCSDISLSSYCTSGAAFEECKNISIYDYSMKIGQGQTLSSHTIILDALLMAVAGFESNKVTEFHDFSDPAGENPTPCCRVIHEYVEGLSLLSTEHEENMSEYYPLLSYQNSNFTETEGYKLLIFVPVKPAIMTVVLRRALEHVRDKQDIKTSFFVIQSEIFNNVITMTKKDKTTVNSIISHVQGKDYTEIKPFMRTEFVMCCLIQADDKSIYNILLRSLQETQTEDLINKLETDPEFTLVDTTNSKLISYISQHSSK